MLESWWIVTQLQICLVNTWTHTPQAYLRELADSTLSVTHLGIMNLQETLPSAIMVTACTKEASKEAVIQGACRTTIRFRDLPLAEA